MRGERLDRRQVGGGKGWRGGRQREEGHDWRKALRKKGMRGISTSSRIATSPRFSGWTLTRTKHVMKDMADAFHRLEQGTAGRVSKDGSRRSSRNMLDCEGYVAF